MFNQPATDWEFEKTWAMLGGREYGIASLIVKASEELEECSRASVRFDGYKIIKVSAEEMFMLADYRRAKIEKARQELEEIKKIRDQIINSLNKRKKTNE